MEKEKKYEEAVQELEQIVRDMESGKLNLDELSTNLKRAQKLLTLCKDKLSKTEEEIQALLASSGQ